MFQPRPYRIIVCGQTQITTGKGKRQRTKVVGSAYVGWNGSETDRQRFDPGRLPGAGTFSWPGLHAVRRAALEYFASDPTVHQVQVRTNQDRPVYLWNRQSDGRISGYRPEREW